MHELTVENALDYLRGRGLVGQEAARIEALAWGVSNVVLRVVPEQREPFVVKQSRTRLRTRDPWFSRLDRIWRETDAMRCLQPFLPAGFVPRVLFEDRDNYLFVMESAPDDHVVWKERLLAGETDERVAAYLGTCLAQIHGKTAGRADVASQFGDREVFVQLRVDPFYRKVAEAHPEVAAPIDSLIGAMFADPRCLVHADYSPKNVLIAPSRTMLVDYETCHFGDPAFDLGFFLSHLLLKGVFQASRFESYARLTTAFRAAYFETLAGVAPADTLDRAALEARGVLHLAGCMWARIDGTSRVDYLTAPADCDCVRDFCRGLLNEPPAEWSGVVSQLRERLAAGGPRVCAGQPLPGLAGEACR